MPPIQVLLVCAAAAGLWYGGRAVKVESIKVTNAIVHVFHPAKGTK